MATQGYDCDVFIKGPLTVGTDLAADQIKATLHLEQPQDTTTALARFVRTAGAGNGSVGLKFNLPAGLPNLQGLRAADQPGDLALNQEGGNLRLGNGESSVSIPGSLTVRQRNILEELDRLQPNPDHLTVKTVTVKERLTVNNRDILAELDKKLERIPLPLDLKGEALIAGAIKVGDKEVINASGQWCGDKTNLQGPGITAVRVAETLDPEREAKATLETIDDPKGDKRLVLAIPRGYPGERGQTGQDGEPGTQIVDVAVDMLKPGAKPTAKLLPIHGDPVGKLLKMEIPRGHKGDTGDSGGGSLNRLNDKPLWLRKSNDENHGIGWYGKGTPFAGNEKIDGPVLFGYAGGALGVNENGNQRIALRWSNAGRVGIGATNPQEKLHVIGHIIVQAQEGVEERLELKADGSAMDINSYGKPLWINNSDNPSSGKGEVFMRTLHLKMPLITDSARSLKENITDLSIAEAVALIDKLIPVRFNYRNDEQKTRHLGFVAEDSPPAITTEDGKAIYPTHIIAALSRVVKEQQRMLVSLTAEVQRLHEQMPLPTCRPG